MDIQQYYLRRQRGPQQSKPSILFNVGQLGTLSIVYFGAQLWSDQGVLIGQMAGGMFAAIFSFILTERLMKKPQIAQLTKTVDPEFKEHQRSFKIMHNRG